MIGIVIGKKINSYVDKNTGDVKTGRTLSVIWDKPKKLPEGETGNRASNEYISFEIPEGVEVGVRCKFEYEIQNTKNGTMARLVDIVPLEKLNIKFESAK